ncbi:MAG: hypothetical protein UHM23_00420 [Clostridia bacterium]|nr:hypothetical protein [Clostridia bacterium]
MRYNNNVIHSDDPQALEKLQNKLAECEKSQEFMKKVNNYYRKNGTVKGCEGVADSTAQKLDESMKNAYSWETAPFPSYKLQNNNQEIRRLKARIEELSKNKDLGFVGWKFVGGEAIANEGNNRLQLIFDEKPSEEQRGILKAHGFKWAPSEGAWQRQLNSNAIYSASRIDFIKPEDGKSPTELQPKAPPTPKKDEPTR